jgi:hypothetical protein
MLWREGAPADGWDIEGGPEEEEEDAHEPQLDHDRVEHDHDAEHVGKQ